MRTILILILGFTLIGCGSTSATETALLIIGDSLSSPEECNWPIHLQRDDVIVRNYAQAGLTLRDFDFPDHIRTIHKAKNNIALIYIGTNDAGSKFPVSLCRFKLQEIVSQLIHRGFNVFVSKLPPLDVLVDPSTSINRIDPYNNIIETLQDVTIIDPSWGSSSTSDGVHPTCMNSYFLYNYFREEMAKIGSPQ